jgi:hypothetical protein
LRVEENLKRMEAGRFNFSAFSHQSPHSTSKYGLSTFSAACLLPQPPVGVPRPIAEELIGDQILKQILHELVQSVRINTSIDWQFKQSVQTKVRVLVKRILRKYKFPPDDPATSEYTVSVNKVLDQAELLADFWTKN